MTKHTYTHTHDLRYTPLRHEARHNAKETAAVVVAVLNKLTKAVRATRCPPRHNLYYECARYVLGENYLELHLRDNVRMTTCE